MESRVAARVAYVCGRVCGLQWVGEFLGDVGKLSGLFMVLGALLCGFVRLRMFLYVDAGYRGLPRCLRSCCWSGGVCNCESAVVLEPCECGPWSSSCVSGFLYPTSPVYLLAARIVRHFL